MNGEVYAPIEQAPVQLAQVHGRDSFGPRGGALGRIDNVTLLLEAGLHVFVGGPEDGTAALCEILAGRRRPRLGAVTIAGRDPARSPALRRRIGALLPVADLPPLRAVSDVVSWVGEVRGVALRAPLEALGIATLGARRVGSLAAQEARAVQLALALALPDPYALVLYEPFAAVGPVEVARVRELLADRVHGGCCVVVATSTPSDVERLLEGPAARVHLLQGGRLAAGAAGLSWPLPERGELTAWVEAEADDLGAFVTALGERPEVSGVGWTAAPGEPASVTVRAEDLVAAAHVLAEATRRGRVRVLAVDRLPADKAGLGQAAARQRLEAARALAPATSPLADAQRADAQRARPQPTGSQPREEP